MSINEEECGRNKLTVQSNSFNIQCCSQTILIGSFVLFFVIFFLVNNLTVKSETFYEYDKSKEIALGAPNSPTFMFFICVEGGKVVLPRLRQQVSL